jgi:hypothetical protein
VGFQDRKSQIHSLCSSREEGRLQHLARAALALPTSGTGPRRPWRRHHPGPVRRPQLDAAITRPLRGAFRPSTDISPAAQRCPGIHPHPSKSVSRSVSKTRALLFRFPTNNSRLSNTPGYGGDDDRAAEAASDHLWITLPPNVAWKKSASSAAMKHQRAVSPA